MSIFFAIVNCNFVLAFFYKPIICDAGKNGNGIHPWKEEAVLMNATQHLKKSLYMCMDNYHLSASNLTTAATTAIVNYKKKNNSSLDASKCIFCDANFFYFFPFLHSES